MAQLPDSLKQSFENTKVTYRHLGASGLRVSVPILGTMSLGHKDWQPWIHEEEAALEALNGAYSRGLNTWDTANTYSNGISEEIIGKAIKKFNIPRHKLVLLTKCNGYVGEEPGISYMRYGGLKDTKDYVNQGGLSRAAIFNAVDASLERLDTEYIDLLQIHRFDPNVPIEETMRALHDLVQAGKVRYIGASSMWAHQFAMMQFVAERNGWTKFISMQNQYSLCYREEEREMNPYCRKTGVGLIPWSPLYNGLLARPLDAPASNRAEATKGSPMGKTLTDADTEIIKRVQTLADQKGWKMSQVALAWVLQKGSVPIVGFSNLDRLDEAIGVRDRSLTDDEMKQLEEPYKPKAIAGHM